MEMVERILLLQLESEMDEVPKALPFLKSRDERSSAYHNYH